jgi:hypothetical protein
MICLFCGDEIGKEFPVPIENLSMTPIVAYPEGVIENKLGVTRIMNRVCCPDCYEKIIMNDIKIMREGAQIRVDKP